MWKAGVVEIAEDPQMAYRFPADIRSGSLADKTLQVCVTNVICCVEHFIQLFDWGRLTGGTRLCRQSIHCHIITGLFVIFLCFQYTPAREKKARKSPDV